MKIVYTLKSKDPLTAQIRANHIESWKELLAIIRNLPYGRNSNREDLSLVWKEQKGTCSSKHAFLKHIAELNAIPNIKLILGMYKMSASNTRNLGNVLSKNGLDYLPEAHCYLKIDGERLDFTSPNSDFNKIKNDILLEKEIQPQQVAEFKVTFHKTYLKDWIITENVPFNFNEIWNIREQCIANLSQ